MRLRRFTASSRPNVGPTLGSTLVGGANCAHVALGITGEVDCGIVVSVMPVTTGHACPCRAPSGLVSCPASMTQAGGRIRRIGFHQHTAIPATLVRQIPAETGHRCVRQITSPSSRAEQSLLRQHPEHVQRLDHHCAVGLGKMGGQFVNRVGTLVGYLGVQNGYSVSSSSVTDRTRRASGARSVQGSEPGEAVVKRAWVLHAREDLSTAVGNSCRPARAHVHSHRGVRAHRRRVRLGSHQFYLKYRQQTPSPAPDRDVEYLCPTEFRQSVKPAGVLVCPQPTDARQLHMPAAADTEGAGRNPVAVRIAPLAPKAWEPYSAALTTAGPALLPVPVGGNRVGYPSRESLLGDRLPLGVVAPIIHR